MEPFSETLLVVDRHSPDTGNLEMLVGAQQRGPWQDLFNFPGGKVDPGESEVEAALRELAEETGLVLAERDVSWLGMINVINLYRTPARLGKVSVYGAHLIDDQPIRSKPDEFSCLWVNPQDRHILLSMPRDVDYWLPTVYAQPRLPFTCTKTVDKGGAISYETYVHEAQSEPVKVATFARSLA